MRALVAAGTMLLFTAIPSFAQDYLMVECGDARQMIERVEKDYGETQVGIGLSGPDTILAIYASANGETWSVIAIHDDGRACQIADGNGWTNLPQGDPA